MIFKLGEVCHKHKTSVIQRSLKKLIWRENPMGMKEPEYDNL